jgi:hypothetical protein
MKRWRRIFRRRRVRAALPLAPRFVEPGAHFSQEVNFQRDETVFTCHVVIQNELLRDAKVEVAKASVGFLGSQYLERAVERFYAQHV